MTATSKAIIRDDLSFAEYLKLPQISAGVVIAMVARCPAAARWAQVGPPGEPSDDTDIGSIAHDILLCGDESRLAVISPGDYLSKAGEPPSGWTNNAIRAARDNARAAGKIPILSTRMDPIRAAVRAAAAFVAELERTEPLVWKMFQPGGGRSEVTIVDGDLKIRPDRISNDSAIIVDAKFTGTSANPSTWARQMVGMGYHIRAAFYRQVTKLATGVDSEYLFLVQETEPPYLTSLIGLDPAAKALGDQMVRWALEEIARCNRTGLWSGYPPRIAYAELPSWEATSWAHHQEQHGIPYDPALLFTPRVASEKS